MKLRDLMTWIKFSFKSQLYTCSPFLCAPPRDLAFPRSSATPAAAGDRSWDLTNGHRLGSLVGSR